MTPLKNNAKGGIRDWVYSALLCCHTPDGVPTPTIARVPLRGAMRYAVIPPPRLHSAPEGYTSEPPPLSPEPEP
jgi:hypothetical protein